MTFLSETLYKCRNLGPKSVSFWVFTFFKNLSKRLANFRIEKKILQKIEGNSVADLIELIIKVYCIFAYTLKIVEKFGYEVVQNCPELRKSGSGKEKLHLIFRTGWNFKTRPKTDDFLNFVDIYWPFFNIPRIRDGPSYYIFF